MNPDDLRLVQRSWSELRDRRATLLAGLTREFVVATPSLSGAAVRAGWLLAAVDELVGLLAAPSSLAARASELGATWPDPLTAPSFAVDGRAWLCAARDCCSSWSDETDAAWRQAWLLLSDVLASEALSPFREEGRGKDPFVR